MKLLRPSLTLALLVSLQLSALSLGQSQNSTRGGGKIVNLPAPKAPPGSIEGVVVSNETGTPVSGATVTLEPSGQRARVLAILLNDKPTPPIPAVTTNERGRFSFPKVEAGSYAVEARRDGFIPQKVGEVLNSGEGKPLALAAGQRIDNVAVRLTRSARISGRIRDAAGQPAAGIPMQLFRSETPEAGLIPVAGTKSASDGSYKLDGFLPGQFTLAAGSLPPSQSSEATPAGSYAARIAAPTTDGVVLNFSLDAGDGYTIRGRVRADSSNVLPATVGWNVTAFAPAGRQTTPYDPARFAYNPQNGAFVLPGFRPGIYRVNGGCGGAVVLVSDADVSGVVLTLQVCP